MALKINRAMIIIVCQCLYVSSGPNHMDLIKSIQTLVQKPMDLLKLAVSSNYDENKTNDIFDIFRDKYPLPNNLKAPYSQYDYIIIGAGSAGCVVANRLTENPNTTVLLLEVGRPESLFTDLPSIAPYFQRTEYSWPYYMEPQPGVCMGMINKKCYWPRGRAVGGSSVINYMIYTRGRPQDWNRIAAKGNYGWSYDEVLEYYKKSERASLLGLEDSPYHGRKGEMNIEFTPTTPLADAFLEAGRILGIPTTDYNAPEQLGFGYVQTNTDSGRRVSAAKAFLHNIKKRTNLHILPLARATKILINEDKVAYGVQFTWRKQLWKIRTREEVILSAGPIASPQLLMLSGIGPRDNLERVGVPVVQDLPVGRTLYDHITFPGLVFTLNTSASLIENQITSNALTNLIEWIQYGNNELATAGAAEGIGYIKTTESDDPENVPDIELISIGGSLVSDGGASGSKSVRRGMMIQEELFDKAYGLIDATYTWTAFPMLLHPKSVGYLELKDNNPKSPPLMYGNYLTHPKDMKTLVASIRFIQTLSETEAFQRLGAKLHPAQFSTCPDLLLNSDEYWECGVRTLTATLHHQIATCRMGPVGDPQAVVDPELRVYGISRLRVVDTSIIPEPISSHTHAPAVMIGEKASDMIKASSLNGW